MQSSVDKARDKMYRLEAQYGELFVGHAHPPTDEDIAKGLYAKRKTPRGKQEWYNTKTKLRWRGYLTVYEIFKDPKTHKLLADINDAQMEFSRLSALARGEKWG